MAHEEVTPPIEPYPSFEVMRQEHRTLQRAFRSKDKDKSIPIDDIETFIRRGTATGLTIEDEDDRWSAQGVLDFWIAILFRHGMNDIDATLQEYNTELSPEFEDDMCPYLGLGTFDESQNKEFHGRRSVINKGIKRIEAVGFLGILGPAGSGKSSLLRAGILPALREGGVDGSEEWYYLSPIAPGRDPLLNLARLLSDVDGEANAIKRAMRKDKRALQIAIDKVVPDGERGVLVIDEFEELFYRCERDEDRLAVAQNLMHLVGKEDRQHVVIIAMLSNYERVVAQYVADLPALYNLFQTAMVRITPPTSNELREVIEKPAAEIGLRFEEDLIDRLLQDVSGEQTALPLLQFTLLRLWERRNRNLITWDAYHDVGGGRDALVETAVNFYESLPKEDRILAKSIFLRLAYPDEGLQVELIPATLQEIEAIPGNKDRLHKVLQGGIDLHLIRNTKVLSTGQMQYELVHEALAQDWVQLVSWLDHERFSKRQRLRLRTAANAWMDNRSPDLLLRGAFLEEAESFQDLSETEQEFVEHSREHFTNEQEARIREASEREALAVQAAEAESRRLVLQKQLTQRLTIAAGILALMAIIAGIASFIAYSERNDANNALNELENSQAALVVARDEAVSAASAAATSEALAISEQQNANESASQAFQAQATAIAALDDAQTALSAQATAVAAEAEALKESEQSLLLAKASRIGAQALSIQDSQTGLSLLLSLEAVRLVDNLNTKNVLLSGLQAASRQTGLQSDVVFENHAQSLFTGVYRPDGELVATGGYDNDIILWNPNTGEQVADTIRVHEDRVRSLQFSPNGQWLASGGYDNQLMLWDVSVPGRPEQTFVSRAHTAAVTAITFSPNGGYLVSGSQAGDFVVWELRLGQQLRRLATPIAHRGPVYDLEFIDNGNRLISVGEDGQVILWDMRRPGFPRQIDTLDGHTTAVNAAAVNSSGELLATGDDAGKVIIWSLETLQPLRTIFAHGNWVFSLDFAPDSDLLVSASRDNSLMLWDAATGNRIAGPYSDHGEWVREASFSPDGSHLLSVGREGNAIVWQVAQTAQLGQDLATVPEPVTDVAQTASGRVVAFADSSLYGLAGDFVDGSWELAREFPLQSPDRTVLSSDGRWLAETLTDTVQVWSATNDADPLVLAGHVSPVTGLAFSTSGDYVATTACAEPPQMMMIEEALSEASENVAAGDTAVSNEVGRVASEAVATGLLSEQSCTESAVIVWDLTSGEPVSPPAVIPNAELMSLAFSLDDTLLAAGGCYRPPSAPVDADVSADSGENTAQQQEVIAVKAFCQEGIGLFWSNPLQGVSESAVTSLQSNSDELLLGHADKVSLLSFAPSGLQLVTASDDGTIVFWDTSNGMMLGAPTNAHLGAVTSLTFDDRGEKFVSTGTDTRLLVWDLAEYQPFPTPLIEHESSIVSALFVENGQRVLSISEDGQTSLIDIGLSAWKELGCRIVNRNMTMSEWTQYIGGDYQATCPQLLADQ